MLLVFLVYLWAFPISQHSDIIAGVLFVVVFLWIQIASVSAYIQYKKLLKKLTCSVKLSALTYQFDGDAIYANRPVRVRAYLKHAGTLPTFGLNLAINWQHEQVSQTAHYCDGTRSEQMFEEELSFPHRGLWTPSTLAVELTDIWGLTSFRFLVPIECEGTHVAVLPEPVADVAIPTIPAQANEGDLVPDQDHRAGDPLDLKRYHPSDGVKKIVWKIFAKTGELVARQPETSIIPEGTVVIYSAMAPQDDKLCAQVLRYIEDCESKQQQVIFSCLGNEEGFPVRSLNDVTELLLEHTWATEQPYDLIKSVSKFLELLRRETNIQTQHILVALSTSLLSDAKVLEQYKDMLSALNENSISPVLILDMTPPQATEGSQPLLKYFLHQPSASSVVDSTSIKNLISFCSQKHIEVVAA